MCPLPTGRRAYPPSLSVPFSYRPGNGIVATPATSPAFPKNTLFASARVTPQPTTPYGQDGYPHQHPAAVP